MKENIPRKISYRKSYRHFSQKPLRLVVIAKIYIRVIRIVTRLKIDVFFLT